MNSTLIPERPMLISATLASTIGLDEAVMLHVLGELVNQARPLSSAEISLCVTLSQEQLKTAFPFWESADISRIQKNLNALGLITFEYKKMKVER